MDAGGNVASCPNDEILADETAAELLSERLDWPHLSRSFNISISAFQQAYQVGQKPVSAEMIESVLAQDINGLESTLTRHAATVLRWWPI